MKNDYPIRIFLDFGPAEFFELNKEIRGKVTFIPQISIAVEKLGYRFILQTRGSLETSSVIIQDVELSGPTQLINTDDYTFDISVFNDRHPTYEGRNVSYLYSVEAYALPPKGEVKEGFFAKIFKSNRDRRFKVEKFLPFNSTPNLFEIQSTETKLIQRSLLKAVFTIIFLTLSVGLFLFAFMQIYLTEILIFLAIFVSLFLFYFLLSKILIGKIEIKFRDLKSELFEVMLKNKWQLVRSISVNYQIEEVVKDNRGTSSSTYTHIFYKSPPKIIRKPLSTVQVVFEYPEEMMPTTTLGDASINWVLEIVVKTSLGIPFKYSGKFVVEKNTP